MWISSKSRSKEGLCKFDKKNQVNFYVSSQMQKVSDAKESLKSVTRQFMERQFMKWQFIERQFIKGEFTERQFIERQFIERQFIERQFIARQFVELTRLSNRQSLERQFIEPTVFDFDQTKYGTFKCKHTMERFLLVEWILPSEYAGFSNAHFNHIHEQRKGWGAVLELWAMETYKKQ